MTALDPRTLSLSDLSEIHLDEIARIEAESNPTPWSRELFAGELAMPVGERHWLVATAADALGDGPVVGFIGAMIVSDEAHIMNVAVAPGWRRQGIARVMLARMLDDLVGRGVRHSTLEVRIDNRPALALYRAFGFEVEGERPNYYAPGLHASILWARDLCGSVRDTDEPRQEQP